MADRALTGVLLVGGASRRFGAPKALAMFEGETLAERAWRILGDVCAERFAVGKTADRLPLPFPLLDDGTTVRAPIAGAVAGLRAASHDVCVILPVDCPLISPDALAALADACADCAVPRSGPLPGAFRRTVLPTLEHRLAAGELALAQALRGLDVRVVDLDPVALANANTPEELAALHTRQRAR